MARFTQGGSSNFGGAELNYVQVVGTQQTISSAPSTVIDLDITTTGKAVQVSVTGEGANASAGSWLSLNLFRDNVEIGNAIQLESSAASENVPFAINFIDDVPAGTYNYSVRVTTISGGNWTFGEAAGPIINAVELTGFKGDRGLRGFTGDQGPQGEQGPAGIDGAAGQDGASAYEIAVDNGFEGTEQEWLDSLGGGSADTANFEFDGNIMATDEDMVITVNGVPGIVNIGAYNGIELSFADVEGAGLRFPDDTVQTTAYTGGDTASHGNFRFDESTLKLDSSDDMVLEKSEGDGAVSAQIKIGAGDIPLEVVAYDERIDNFSSGDWSTASWETGGEGGGVVILTGSPNVESFLNTFYGDFQKVIINDTYMYQYNGAGYGGGNVTIYTLGGPEDGIPVEVTSLTFAQSFKTGMIVDLDENELILRTSNGDIVLDSDDDIDISASDDIRFYSNDDDNSYNWRMTSEGIFELPGNGYIENPENSSGDGNGYSTIKIVPDGSREEQDQYLIVDPTQPNHIHIRAGGQQGNSQAELIVGGEDTNVKVVDSGRYVSITSQNPDTTETHQNISETAGSTMFIGTAIQHIDYVIVDGIKHYVDGSVSGNYYQPYLESGTTEIVVPSVVFQPDWSYEFGVQIGGQNSWQFQSDGFLSGPVEASVKVYGLYNDSDYALPIVADNAIVLRSNGAGEFLNDETIPNNQIATIGDIEQAILPFEIDSSDVEFATLTSPNRSVRLQTTSSSADIRIDSSDRLDITSVDRARLLSDSYIEVQAGEEVSVRSLGSHVVLGGSTGEFLNTIEAENQIATIGDISNATPAETSFTVNGGSLETQPTFNGDPLFSGSYVMYGPMVHFEIQVDMDNITSFGTGQYFVQLPFPAKYAYQFKNGCLHDISTGNQFAIGGHVVAGSTQLLLSFTGSNGQDEVFDFNSPVTLTTADNFHISGDYIASFD